MPDFLEKKLRREYGTNTHAIFGTMNAIGAMRGNKITAKGREMEQKHEDKMKHNIEEVHIQIHRDKNKNVTGHTVHNEMMPKKTGKSGAFMERERESYPFDAAGKSSSHGPMMAHIGKSLGLSGAGANSAANEAEPEEEGEEEEES